MDASQIYMIISIATLVIVALLVFFLARSKKEKTFTPMTDLAFGFILTGMLFGSDRLFNYSMMGTGVILAFVDMFRKLRAEKQSEE